MVKFNLLHKDCLDILDKIPAESINAIITDPPYVISKPTNFHIGGGWNDKLNKARCKTPPKSEFGEWDKQKLDWDILISHFYRILKPSGTLIVFYDVWKLQEMKECAEKFHFKQPRLCRWDKTNPVPINSKKNYLTNASEYFLTFVKGGKPTFHSEYDKGIYVSPICGGKERTIHPTQKPLLLLENIILKHTNENDVVFDPFAGSGTIGEAAIKNKRIFIGCEIEKSYYEIGLERCRRAVEMYFN